MRYANCILIGIAFNLYSSFGSRPFSLCSSYPWTSFHFLWSSLISFFRSKNTFSECSRTHSCSSQSSQLQLLFQLELTSGWDWKCVNFCVLVHAYVDWMLQGRAAWQMRNSPWHTRQEAGSLPLFCPFIFHPDYRPLIPRGWDFSLQWIYSSIPRTMLIQLWG